MTDLYLLNPEAVKREFDEIGAVWPLRVFTDEQVAVYRQHLLAEISDRNLMASDYRCKSQVLFPWMAEIVKSAAIRHYVGAVLGDDFHCWDTLFWVKEPNDGKIVSYHQDATYWNFAPKDAVTVWLAFNDVTCESGAIRYRLRSHKDKKQLEHHDVRSESNLLMRGQTAVEPETGKRPRRLMSAEVPAGHITMHSPYIVHGSSSNTSSEPRLACGMIFAAGHVKPIANFAPESTLWVQGEDRHGHFIHDPVPTGDWDTDRGSWQAAYDRQHVNYYKMSPHDSPSP
jgi:ectoine hydroxylase-related dioxygenase (phytanoyl-CoA dioxygenase family)